MTPGKEEGIEKRGEENKKSTWIEEEKGIRYKGREKRRKTRREEETRRSGKEGD